MSRSVEVSSLPSCDLCAHEGREATAKYDAATRMGPWANLCPDHFASHGIGLGTGVGQELILVSVEPDPMPTHRLRSDAFIAHELGLSIAEVRKALG